MHPTFFILPLVALIPICVYFFLYLGKMAHFFGLDRESKEIKIIIGIILIVMVFLSHSFFSIGFFTIVHIIAFALIMALINLIYRKAAKVPKGQGNTIKDSNLWQKIYGCRLVPIVLAAACMIFGYFNMTNVVEKDFTVETEKSLNQDYKVAMIADLHMGVSMDVATLQKYCDEISAQNPDLLIIAGDLVDENTTMAEMKGACKAIGSIDTKYGIYYVYGNHDATQFIWEPEYDGADLEAALTANNITVMKDQSYLINDDFYVIGRKDAAYMKSDRKSVKKLIKGLDKSRFMLVADHQPITLDETSAAGVDLQLSGHTHAGQLWPLGILAQTFGFCDLNEGQADWNGMEIIVSSGFAGFGSPIRTESHSAYEIINIRGK